MRQSAYIRHSSRNENLENAIRTHWLQIVRSLHPIDTSLIGDVYLRLSRRYHAGDDIVAMFTEDYYIVRRTMAYARHYNPEIPIADALPQES